MADEPKKTTPIAPPSLLSRPTDAAPKPGFRAPPNKGSKAQKSAVAEKGKGKKK